MKSQKLYKLLQFVIISICIENKVIYQGTTISFKDLAGNESNSILRVR